MSIFSKVKSLFDVGRSVYGYAIESPLAVPCEFDQARAIGEFQGWVYTCSNKNAVRVASQPLRLYVTTGAGQLAPRVMHRALQGVELQRVRSKMSPRLKDADVAEVLEHPVLELLDYVNELQGRFELFELTELGMELTGNAYWWLTPGELGLPREILVLPPHLVKIILGGDNLVRAYELGTGADKKTIPYEQVIHFRFPNPNGSVYGYGPTQAAWGAVLDYRSMQLYERALNTNQGVPSLFIQYEGTVEKSELARIESDWNRKLRGVGKAGKAHVGDSKFKVIPIGLSPRDMSFRDGRRWSRLEIADCFGVPQDLLDSESSNRATAEQANYQYEQFTIKPRLVRISDKLTERLVPFYDNRLFFQYDENVPEDKAGKLNEVTGLSNAGLITADEGRALYDYPPFTPEQRAEMTPTPAPVTTPTGV